MNVYTVALVRYMTKTAGDAMYGNIPLIIARWLSLYVVKSCTRQYSSLCTKCIPSIYEHKWKTFSEQSIKEIMVKILKITVDYFIYQEMTHLFPTLNLQEVTYLYFCHQLTRDIGRFVQISDYKS